MSDIQTPGVDRAAIAANLARVRAQIAEAAAAAGRETDAVTLVAVGKTHGAAYIEAALDAGQRVFGENRVQEAEAKFPALKAAQKDPDGYRNLLVRVTGYNAYFVNLGREIQEEMIARIAHQS